MTSWVERHGIVTQQLAHAAAPEHGLRDQRRLGPVVAGCDEILEALCLHGFPIGRSAPILSTW
jgi:hypothetical protein